MKLFNFLFLSIFIFQIAYGQQPCTPTIYNYPTDNILASAWVGSGFKVAPTADGGSIICGSQYNVNDDKDVLLMKIDLFGNLVWEQTYGDSLNDTAEAVLQTPDGG